MGVDAFIFATKAKKCFYFDRKYNYVAYVYEPVYEDLLDKISNKIPINNEQANYIADANIDYWNNSETDSHHRVIWNKLIKQFIEMCPNDLFLIHSDHDTEPYYSHDVIRNEGYEKVQLYISNYWKRRVESCRKRGKRKRAAHNKRLHAYKPLLVKENQQRQEAINSLIKALEAGSYSTIPDTSKIV